MHSWKAEVRFIIIFHGSNKRESVFQMPFIVSFLSLTFRLNHLFCLNDVISFYSPIAKIHERKTRRAPFSPSLLRAPLLSSVPCLLGSYFVSLYATFLIDLCSLAMFVAAVWGSSTDPRKNALCLLPSPRVWSVCPHGRRVIFTCTILFVCCSQLAPSPLSCRQVQTSGLYPPTPIRIFDGFVALLPSHPLFFPQKSFSLSSLL